MEGEHQYKCLTCGVAFTDLEQLREHYKTDWHRYNLKRKVAAMPPVTLETFRDKMSKHQEKIMASKN